MPVVASRPKLPTPILKLLQPGRTTLDHKPMDKVGQGGGLQSPFIHTRRYGPLRGPASSTCRKLWPLAEAFFPLRANKKAYYATLAHFRPFLVFSNKLGYIVMI